MVVLESIMSPGEVESPLQSEQHQSRNNDQNALIRQSSIYSLTLDEFQHTLNETGKNFGSMNMDEFLSSIWTAEENQAHPPSAITAGGTTTMTPNPAASSSAQFLTGINTSSVEPNLARQGSLTLPGRLSRKTVDEVWSEIQKSQHDQIPSSAQRQPTYGEMTLEDFLVKAGVVRETNNLNAQPVQQQVPPPFGLYPNGNNCGPPHGSAHMVRTMIGISAGGGPYQPQPPPCYGGVVRNGGGYGQGPGIGSPVSPVSSDGMATSQLDSGNQYGLDMGGIRGSRRRIIDGPVERRQKRMIKNRESAARSRARKQAYTVELEAELNMLKEENGHLKQVLFYEEMRMKSAPKIQKPKEKSKSRMLRRTSSCLT